MSKSKENGRNPPGTLLFYILIFPDRDPELSFHKGYGIILFSDHVCNPHPEPFRHEKENLPWIPAISVIF